MLPWHAPHIAWTAILVQQFQALSKLLGPNFYQH